MPMECHRTQPKLATSGPSWNMTEWPFIPEHVRQQMEADKDKPKATERLYSRDGHLVVAPGHVLPENAHELLTEDQALGREPVPELEPEQPATRRRVRRK